MKALITSGGKGTRLRPLTYTQNKHLIPIANKPILHYAVEAIAEAGIVEIGILVNANDEEVPRAMGDGSQWGVRFTYIPQEAPLGLAHVVKISQEFLGDDKFLFYLGDNMIVGGVRRFIESFNNSQANCQLALALVKDPNRFGVPELRDGKIVRVIEKPKNPPSQYAVAGIYLYDSNIFEAVNALQPSPRGELEISEAHQYMIDRGFHVTHSEITGWWKDTGRPEDLLEANRLILENYPQQEVLGEIDASSNLIGTVNIGKGSQIINSHIRGPVIIGDNCSIRNSFIGPFTSIYHNCEIENSEIEYSIVLEGCQIHDIDRRIGNSLLGSEVKISKSKTRPQIHQVMLSDRSQLEIC